MKKQEPAGVIREQNAVPVSFSSMAAKCNALNDLILCKPMRMDRSEEGWFDLETDRAVGVV